LKRKLALRAFEWLIARPGSVPRSQLQRWIRAVCNSDRDREIVVNELKEWIKAGSPPIAEFDFDVPPDGRIGFENLARLFASTTLDEYLITMNVRQSAYLFDLIRRMQVGRVIEVGRHWGGTTVLIAAAMEGRGDFWSIADPRELDWDVQHRGRSLPRPIEDQLGELLPRLGLSAHIVAGDPKSVRVDTGEVDLVHIDGQNTYEAAMSDFERFGRRVRVGGAVLFDDAIPDDFCDSAHTADVKRVCTEVASREDFRLVRTVRRLAHFERVR
jgi:predicted O-methyltransferase YrrM